MVEQQADGTIEFRFFRPEARTVNLSGDFNAWHETCMPMERRGGGWWTYRLWLAPGVYQFRYIADGVWLPDYAAFGLEGGPFGWNSVLLVREAFSAPAGKLDRDRLRDERSKGTGRRHIREELIPSYFRGAAVRV